MDYSFKELESKWQKNWAENKQFETDINTKKPKYYCLDMFPYPSGAGLHVGHPEGYFATDIISRYKRMKGFEVLHPMGWDSFGLPAERYAMKTGIHPEITTTENINNFRRQLKMLGLSFDWTREIKTSDSGYYKFTQWIFLQLYNSYYDLNEKKAKSIHELIMKFQKNGSKGFENLELFSSEEWSQKSELDKEEVLKKFRLVYQAEIPVNWCEELGTVLANEEVEEWVSKGYIVERRPMRQYMMRITSYAERLLTDLNLVEWPASTLEMQKNWIGKSEGLQFFFVTENHQKIEVYTTRPDTIFGATYLVLAPEHPLVHELMTENTKEAVLKYKKETSLKSDLDRTELNKDKSGVFLGAYAIHPVIPDKKIPIWISDYVLYGYGTGAIMAVPAHDKRDKEFAEKFQLEIVAVIKSPNGEDFYDGKESVCFNSKSDVLSIDGLNFQLASDKVNQWMSDQKIGFKKIQYKLRDWLFARQRYWGEPIPLVNFFDGTTKPISEEELPLTLPNIKEFKPSGTGESPLAFATDWLEYVDVKTGREGKRETNTMPQWAGSCWYYLRYIDPNNLDIFCDKNLEKKWMPVDLYVGGAEHAVLHLLYARFWHKVLFDLGYVSTPEPFKKLIHQGLILGEDKKKMSKSLGNVINPDDVVSRYGVDSMRLFEMFMGPFDMVKPWSEKGVEGIHRFLNRVWRLFHSTPNEEFFLDDIEPELIELKILNKTIKKVEEDILNFCFNTAISQLMIFVNEFTPLKRRPRKILEKFILILSPLAPHLSEELWERAGHKTSLTFENFPTYDPKYLVDDTIIYVVQINGKVRDNFEAEKDLDEKSAIEKAKSLEKVATMILNKEIKREIYVKNKLVNIVI